VGHECKSMKAGRSATSQKGCWRNIAITLTTAPEVAQRERLQDRNWCKRPDYNRSGLMWAS
jgi:hypothetical protein